VYKRQVQARELNASGGIVLRCQLAPPAAATPVTGPQNEVSALDDGWYEPVHGRIDRVALVYLAEVGVSALRRARTKRPDLTAAEQQAVKQEARGALARRLGKPVEQLDHVDLLDDSEARFKVLTTSFREGLGEIVWPPTLSEEERALWEAIGKRRDYVTTVIVVYPTKADGTPDEAQLSSHLRKAPLEQLWRDHLLAGSIVLDGRAGYERGTFAVVYPSTNVPVASAAASYRACLRRADDFKAITLETLLATLERHGSHDWPHGVAERYLGL